MNVDSFLFKLMEIMDEEHLTSYSSNFFTKVRGALMREMGSEPAPTKFSPQEEPFKAPGFKRKNAGYSKALRKHFCRNQSFFKGSRHSVEEVNLILTNQNIDIEWALLLTYLNTYSSWPELYVKNTPGGDPYRSYRGS